MCLEVYVDESTMDSINVFRKNSYFVSLKELLGNLNKLKLTQRGFDGIVLAIESSYTKDGQEVKISKYEKNVADIKPSEEKKKVKSKKTIH